MLHPISTLRQGRNSSDSSPPRQPTCLEHETLWIGYPHLSLQSLSAFFTWHPVVQGAWITLNPWLLAGSHLKVFLAAPPLLHSSSLRLWASPFQVTLTGSFPCYCPPAYLPSTLFPSTRFPEHISALTLLFVTTRQWAPWGQSLWPIHQLFTTQKILVNIYESDKWLNGWTHGSGRHGVWFHEHLIYLNSRKYTKEKIN